MASVEDFGRDASQFPYLLNNVARQACFLTEEKTRVRARGRARHMIMQLHATEIQALMNVATAVSSVVPPDSSVTEGQIADLRETWLQQEIAPVAESEVRGVPYSPLND